ncbi:MAG: hypothetical protein V4491_07830 [Pseudomonadota bacterium]
MARFEGDIQPATGKPLEIDELLALLDESKSPAPPVGGNARACYLSAGEGWREAVKQLGGAFADDVPTLTQGQRE